MDAQELSIDCSQLTRLPKRHAAFLLPWGVCVCLCVCVCGDYFNPTVLCHFVNLLVCVCGLGTGSRQLHLGEVHDTASRASKHDTICVKKQKKQTKTKVRNERFHQFVSSWGRGGGVRGPTNTEGWWWWWGGT